MMYNEFLTLSGANYNEITGEYYMKFIEPVYQCSPEEMFKDKQDFINWWKKNKEICKWMSTILRQKANTEHNVKELTVEIAQLREIIYEQKTTINKLESDIEEHKLHEEELEKSKEEAIYSLRLSIAFAPDKTMNDLKLYFFPKYEEAKKDAIEQGIIKG